jgi:hypothetical protein
MIWLFKLLYPSLIFAGKLPEGAYPYNGAHVEHRNLGQKHKTVTNALAYYSFMKRFIELAIEVWMETIVVSKLPSRL